MKNRKKEHIDLAFDARIESLNADKRFYYEPLLSAHPTKSLPEFEFAGKKMRLPIWVSSMTGGTKKAGDINRNLARASKEFGMGMALGSCRVLLEDESHFDDFNLRPILGDDVPFYANLGIAQLEELLEQKATDKINNLIEKLDADGIIIHINPLQEAFQPEGDIFKKSPSDTLKEFLQIFNGRVIVKEVGQGMGPESLKELLSLPLEAIEFGALGGTNFTLLELMRHNSNVSEYEKFASIGHSAYEMTKIINDLVENGLDYKCKQLIISGGITDILDGYFLQQNSKIPAVIGMGSALLKVSMGEYDELETFLKQTEKNYKLAKAFLKPKKL